MIKFETDGVRGGPEKVNPELAYNLGLGVAEVTGGGQVPVGGDTRESTESLLQAFTAGLNDGGAEPLYMGVTTTPAIAHASQTEGIYSTVVTASHNPWQDNGIKVFAPGGYKIGNEISERLEWFINDGRRSYGGQTADYPLAQTLLDNYDEYLYASLEDPKSLVGMRVVFDGANGAGYETGPRLLRRLGVDLTTMACEPNGRNINEFCGAGNKQKLALLDLVRESKAEVGFTVDGDADRVMLVTESGRIMDGDRLMYILARQAKSRGEKIDKVVGTIMSNLGFGFALNSLGIELMRAKVGDKYVTALMEEKDVMIGGEQAGHVILRDFAPSGDGHLSGIKAIEAIRASGESADKLSAEMIDYPQILLNLKGADKSRLDDDDVKDIIQEAEDELAEDYAFSARASGTEPLVRVMVQSSRFNQGKVEKIANRIGDKIMAGRPAKSHA